MQLNLFQWDAVLDNAMTQQDFFAQGTEKPLGGGTGHTIRVCREMGVEVFTQENETDG